LAPPPPPRPVVLELTEHDRVDDYGALRDALSRLTPHVHVSIDDAGAGFASLRHVLELRPEFMKLDRSWIAGLDADPTRQALVCGLSHFSRATGCRLIAEGVERAGEASALQQFDVELGQGFLFGEPAPA
jgi:EAL domain-containing protein (putative c-di-GMP-specific phosphodiesterase class I)